MVLRVGHQAEDDAGRVAHAGDAGDGPVRVVPCITQGDLPGGGEAVGVGMDVATLAVGDGAVDGVVERGGPDAPALRLGGELDPAAVEAAVLVVTESARQQAGAGQHLEPVADADDWSAARHERSEALAEAPTGGAGQVEPEHAPAPSASP